MANDTSSSSVASVAIVVIIVLAAVALFLMVRGSNDDDIDVDLPDVQINELVAPAGSSAVVSGMAWVSTARRDC